MFEGKGGLTDDGTSAIGGGHNDKVFFCKVKASSNFLSLRIVQSLSVSLTASGGPRLFLSRGHRS